MYKLFIIIFVLAVNSCNALSAKEVINKVSGNNQKVIALTFDDGPIADVLPSMLDILKKEQVNATFFMVGEKVMLNAELVKRAIAEGHEIGNHSMSHKKLIEYDAKTITEEVEGFQHILTTSFNYTPVIFRAPYLKHNELVWRTLKDNKLSSIGASIRTKDARKHTPVNSVVIRATENAHSGAIILMHERIHTLKALPETIQFYKAQGYSFLTVSELLKV